MAIETDAAPPAAVDERSTSSLVRASLARAAGNVGWIILSLVVTMLLWVGFLHLYHVPKVIGRSPVDVYHYLFTQKASTVHRLRSAAGNRSVLWHNLRTTLRKVQIPSAVPSIFAALRINVPAAVIGALLAEWLATDKGSGAEMLEVINTFDYGELWSAVVLVTLVSIVAYSVVSTIEAAVVPRFAPDTVGRKT